MTTDPYAPPQAALAPPHAEPTMPNDVLALILSGVTAAAVMILFTAVGTLRMFNQPAASVYVAFNASLIVVMLGLAYGIYRGSRTCAVLALITYLTLHAIVSLSRGTLPGWLTIAIAALFLAGVIGTFRWHAWRAAQRRAPAS